MEPQNQQLSREPHLTVEQVARRRNLSSDTVRRLFLTEPGVIVIKTPKPHKRVYRSLRIPESVEQRVFGRFTNGGRI
jgi:transcriptional regulator GlxA family with amidase domain